MSYRQMRRALLEKLSITPQALSQRVKRKKRDLPMSTQDATCVIAHEEGITIDKFLPDDQLARVRSLVSQVPAPNPPRVKRKRRKRTSDRRIEVRFPKEFRVEDPILPKSRLNEAKEMAAVYPLLYVLENSIREVIKRVMADRYGEDWWDTQLTKGKVKTVRNNADNRRKTEEKKSWHQRRGDHPIDYTDFGDLLKIIQAKHSDFFPDVIAADQRWFEQFMRELLPSRHVVCHMNPLDKLNIKDVKHKLERWNRLISEKRDNIP